MGEAILVTGASGFIGSHLVRALAAAGFTVHPHSRRVGDIAHDELAFDDVRHVFHLAARTFVPDSVKRPAPFYEVNVLGTVNVLELCRRTGASLTFLSSYVYGPPQTLPIDEHHPLAAYNPYSHTKILGEEVVAYYADFYRVRATVVRPFNVYGPGQEGRFLIPEVIQQVLDPDLDATTVKDLRPKRDYLYVEDLVALLLKTVNGPAGIYNAGSGTSESVQWIVDTVSGLAGVARPARCIDEPRDIEVLDVRADVSRAARELDWRPTTSLREGLARTIAAMRAQNAETR